MLGTGLEPARPEEQGILSPCPYNSNQYTPTHIYRKQLRETDFLCEAILIYFD